MPGHVVLLGDSILDNGAYVASGSDVLSQLRARLPEGWQATLNALDGAVIAGVLIQLERLPRGATHLVISAGGNDALRGSGVLMQPAGSVMEALLKVGEVRDAFQASYRTMLERVAATRLPVALCTIYDVPLPDPLQRRLANLALGVLNDVITREAARRRLPLIDLRVIFTDPDDYANAIEPSGKGAGKIVTAITSLLAAHDFSGRSVVYTD